MVEDTIIVSEQRLVPAMTVVGTLLDDGEGVVGEAVVCGRVEERNLVMPAVLVLLDGEG